MALYIGSDHAGFGLKNVLREHLKTQGKEVVESLVSCPLP